MTRKACLDELAAAIVGIKLDHPTRVAIDGVDGSGKTTLANELVAPIRRAGREVIRASGDGFHNPRTIRYARGPDSAEGYFLDSFNYVALRSELLEPLGPLGNGKFRTAVFDYRSERAVEEPCRLAHQDAILLFDGVFLLRSELYRLWDAKMWLDVPFEISVERAVSRDSRSGLEPNVLRDKYEGRYVPGQRLYMDQCRPSERADFVFNNTDFERPELRFVNPHVS
jgi:uridine kinase